nr:putative RNA-directed DNA polymerase [Tanacetum cinerariifolium]
MWNLVKEGIGGEKVANPSEAQKKAIDDARLKDLKVKNYIFQAIEREILETILNKSTTKEIWDSMRQKYEGSTKVKRAQLQDLRREYELLSMKVGEKVDTYLSRTLTVVNKIKANGDPLTSSSVVAKILRSLTLKFNYVEEDQVLKVTTSSSYCEWEKDANYAECDDSEEMVLTVQGEESNLLKKLGNDVRMAVMGKGHVLLEVEGITYSLTDVYYVPDLMNNLISVGQANPMSSMENGTNGVCHKAEVEIDSNTQLWHQRFGHINTKSLQLLHDKNLVKGLPPIKDEDKPCADFLVGKQARESFPKTSSWRATQRLQLIHSDIYGSISPQLSSEKRYVINFIDDFSRKCWSYFLTEKSQALEAFKKFKVLVEKEAEVEIKCLRTYRGGEFNSGEFKLFCKSHGIRRQLTAAYTPHQKRCGRKEESDHFEYVPPQILKIVRQKKNEATGSHHEESKANRLYDPVNNKIVISKDVVFEEENAWPWNQGSVTEKSDLNWEDDDHESDDSTEPDNTRFDGSNDNRCQISPQAGTNDERRKRVTKTPIWLNDYVSGEGLLSDDENVAMFSSTSYLENYEEASQEECWKLAMKQEIESTEKNHTWELSQQGMKVHQLDVRSAFLYGELEETMFVEQPQGFEIQGQEEKVYRLRKAFAPMNQHSLSDKEKEMLIVSVYVDDLIVTGSNLCLIEEFKTSMKSKFEMSDMGEMHYFLGVEVVQNEMGISICQKKFALEILARFNMEDCNGVKNPIVPGCKLVKDDHSGFVSATLYKQMMGCIMYLMTTRPDLMFVVSLLSRYMEAPTKQHVEAMKRVLRYIQGTSSFGVCYKKKGSDQLVAFSDSDYASDYDNRRSTSGYVCFLSGAAVAWSSKRQPIMALSTTEAEFVAATTCACQVIWLRRILRHIGLPQEESTIIACDNMGYRIGVIELKYCNTQSQIADLMTKPLKLDQFEKLRSRLGMSEIN